eukprot:704207_1
MSFTIRRLCVTPKYVTKHNIFHNKIHHFSLTTSKYPFLTDLGLSDYNLGVFNGEWIGNGPEIKTYSPTTNEEIATIKTGNSNDYESCIESMTKCQSEWNTTPAPKRGEIVRTIGEILREKKKKIR